MDLHDLKSVLGVLTIPDGTKSIDASAFEGRTDIDIVNIPDSVEYIGESAFKGCRNLKGVDVPDSVKWIRADAFADCKNLEYATLPSSLVPYDSDDECPYDDDFENDGNLDCFNGCSSLKSIKIPDGVSYVNGFTGCTSLKAVEFPDSVEQIGFEAFADCERFAVSLPPTLKVIESRAFYGCDSHISKLDIPPNVEEIGFDAFACCKIDEVNVPAGTKRIGCGAFRDSGVKAITLPGDFKTNLDLDDSCVFDNQAHRLFTDMCITYHEYGIPESIIDDDNESAYGMIRFTGAQPETVKIADGSDHINPDVFDHLPGVRSIEIPGSIKKITGKLFCCDNGFDDWENNDYRIYDARNGDSGFDYFDGYADDEPDEYIRDIIHGNFDRHDDYKPDENIRNNISSIVVHEGVEVIDRDAFSNFQLLEHVTLPSSLKFIDAGAFRGCSLVRADENDDGPLFESHLTVDMCRDTVVMDGAFDEGVTIRYLDDLQAEAEHRQAWIERQQEPNEAYYAYPAPDADPYAIGGETFEDGDSDVAAKNEAREALRAAFDKIDNSPDRDIDDLEDDY